LANTPTIWVAIWACFLCAGFSNGQYDLPKKRQVSFRHGVIYEGAIVVDVVCGASLIDGDAEI